MKTINSKFFLNIAAGLLSIGVADSARSLELSQSPLFLAQPVRPLVMLNMSNDHQLYFKAYDDYTDLDPEKNDGPDTTYKNSYDYYGYFDSNKCYSYNSTNNRFEPEGWATNQNGLTAEEIAADDTITEADRAAHYCVTAGEGEWSGNFLNWASMTRMDAVRKILYGGYRSTDDDENGVTVLERAFLPHDAHSFAKYYNGTDISKLTSFNSIAGGSDTADSGITFCNTTSGSGLSQSVTSEPEIRVAKGNFSLWASSERWQCRWAEENNSDSNGHNSNTDSSGIPAYSFSPFENSSTVEGDCIEWDKRGRCERHEQITVPADKLGEFYAQVQVCATGLLEDNCRAYPEGNYKPSGLLQRYGQSGEIHFGLMTGSYSKNKSGGVLRRNISDFSSEINADSDGTFKDNVNGIVQSINKMQIYGYAYSGHGDRNGTYRVTSDGGDNCDWGQTNFSDGQCSNWGNPQSEIYMESLRYLAGKTSARPTGVGDGTTTYNVEGNDKILGLTSATWVAPITSNNYCANTSIIQFNASSSSFDGDTYDDLGINIAAKTRTVGANELDATKTYFVGTSGDQRNQLCTAKSIGDLSTVTGTCPDAPRMSGTYNIAGMAYHARSEGIAVANVAGAKKVTTYGVALAPAVPKVDVPVPGSANGFISILPACRNKMYSNGNLIGETNCAIVDFKIIEQNFTDTENSGKLYVNWEDSEQGGDFDQDMWGTIEYKVTGSTVRVTTDVIADSTSSDFRMGFGYVIGGTQTDGFHAHSGIYGFTYDSGKNDSGCSNCQKNNGPTTAVFDIGTSSSLSLESPLYYAAKWGGYSDKQDGTALTPTEIAASEPETYFYAIEPSELEESLASALEQVLDSAGSSASVAANSTRLGTNTMVYQAKFDSGNWTGTITAQQLNFVEAEEEGEEDRVELGTVSWTTSNNDFDSPSTRNIGTSVVNADGDKVGAAFRWANLDTTQQALLNGSDGNGENVVNWIRGQNVDGLRERKSKLGDVVNSSPVFAGTKKYNFSKLPAKSGGPSYLAYYNTEKNIETRKNVVYVGANDGMLHAFDAENGDELFAYVPSPVYGKLKALSAPNYGGGNNPHTYTVDGPIFVGDAYIGDENGGSWKNILVGTMGAGAKGLFVLDVTDPANFNPATDVLFEITENDMPEIGNITGPPILAPTLDGWKIFVGNGYNSSGATPEVAGTAALLVIDLINPLTDSAVISVGGAGDNGLAGPSLLSNGAGLVVKAYAGDLLGNMWRFNLTSTVETESGATEVVWGQSAQLLFSARDAADRVQPITAPPVLGLNEQKNNATMVYFGTGSYLTSTDNGAGSAVHSVYALTDLGSTIPGRSALFQKQISTETDTTRQVSNDDDTTWWQSKSGWYLDLSFTGSVTGERVTSKPLLEYDRLLFPTLIPSSVACEFGGSGWEMELKAVGDKHDDHSIFGEAGVKSEYAVVGYPNLIKKGDKVTRVDNNNQGEMTPKDGDKPTSAHGRMSWRQIR